MPELNQTTLLVVLPWHYLVPSLLTSGDDVCVRARTWGVLVLMPGFLINYLSCILSFEI